MSAHYNVKDMHGWAVFDPNGKVVSIHDDKLDTRIAAFRYETLERTLPPATPEAYPIYWD